MPTTATDPRKSHLTIAVLGTGIMGAPIARHLSAAGHAVSAWDVDPARSGTLDAAGVRPTATAAQAVAGARVVITMLTDATVTGEVAEAALAGFSGLWIQSATVGPDGTAALLELAARHGVTMIDCPLLGTRSSAQAGELTALASGPEDAEALGRSVLAAYAPRVLWLGPAGMGSRLKLVMNNWVIGLTALTAETIALAGGLGFAGEDFLALIEGGPLDVRQAHIKGEMMQRGEYTPALALRHAAKDARLIATAAEQAGLQLPIGAAVADAFERALDAGHGDEDMSAIYATLVRR